MTKINEIVEQCYFIAFMLWRKQFINFYLKLPILKAVIYIHEFCMEILSCMHTVLCNAFLQRRNITEIYHDYVCVALFSVFSRFRNIGLAVLRTQLLKYAKHRGKIPG